MISLYLVATPIGNFQDMTFRSVEILKSVDIILCEDTRNTKLLLAHFNIQTPLQSYHIFNENEKVTDVLLLLKEGKTLALVSDAGYPGISDPGFLVCNKAIEEGFEVSVVPGATASLTALVGSGLPCEKFYFFGFLAHTSSQKTKELKSIIDIDCSIILYDSPLRIKETIKLMFDIFGNRRICIARELTKKYEEYIRGSLEELSKLPLELKGEIVIILEGAKKKNYQIELSKLTIKEHYNYYINEGIEYKEAMKKVAQDRNVPKSEVYKELKIK